MQKCVVCHELRDILAYPLVPKLWSKDQRKTGVPMPLFAMRQERRESHKFWGFLGVFIRFGIAVIAWEGFDYAEHIWISLCDEVFVLFLEAIASWDHKALRDQGRNSYVVVKLHDVVQVLWFTKCAESHARFEIEHRKLVKVRSEVD